MATPVTKQKSFAGHIFAPITITRKQLFDLLTPLKHAPQSKRQRYALIISRVQLISAIFAVLGPLWIVIDYIVIPDQWQELAVMRIISMVLFVLIILPRNLPNTLPVAMGMLVAMLSIPPVLYLATLPALSEIPDQGIQGVLRDLYSFLPYTVVGGLSIFPLTVIEVLAFSLPVFGITAFGTTQFGGASWEQLLSTLWLLLLICGISCFSCISQLQYMIALVNRAALDPLTNAYTRRTGTETLDLQFRIATVHDNPMAIAFFDLDNFKSVNDTYGHDEGDKALQVMADKLRLGLRRGDSLIRWGGEEFLLLLSDADHGGARMVIERILEQGFGTRPDGSPLTASVGISERHADQAVDWPAMIDIADKRMYMAKEAGRNRAIFPDNDVILGPTA